MRHESEEPDYLAGTQLEVDPHSFIQVVREAFLLEHGCIERQDIGRVLNVDKSRITQIFGDPKKLKPESIQKLLDHLSNKSHQRRILKAWMRECFGVDVADRSIGTLTGDMVGEKTLRRIDRQIRQSRLWSAAQIATEAIRKTQDQDLREQLLDRAFMVRQRLDEPGQAMSVAKVIALGAQRRGEMRRLGAAHMFRARVLIAMPDSKPSELQPVLEEVAKAIDGLGPIPSERPPYFLANEPALASLHLTTKLTFMERGMIKASEQNLREMLSRVQLDLSKRATYQHRFFDHIIASRIHLLLGETFQAQEHVDQAFASGGVKNLNAVETCGLAQARIFQVSESPEVARDHLKGVIRTCSQSLDHYHKRLAETDLARLESSMFPPSRPVV